MLRGSTPALLAAALVGAGVVVVATRRPPRRAAPPVKPRDPGDEPQVPPQPPADSAELWERERKVAPLPSVLDVAAEPEEPAFDDGTPGARRAAKLPPRGVGDLLEGEFAPVDRGAPLAPATTESLWPVRTKARSYLQVSYWSGKGVRGRSGNAFGAKRKDGDGRLMYHAGMDLGGDEGDVVVAPEAGTVVDIVKFYHGTWAVYLRVAGDLVINLGEIAYPSWREFGIKPGSVVERGQPVARIGKMLQDSMLHVETWDGSGMSDEAMRTYLREGLGKGLLVWRDRTSPPDRLLDPSAYLLQASENQYLRDQGAA